MGPHQNGPTKVSLAEPMVLPSLPAAAFAVFVACMSRSPVNTPEAGPPSAFAPATTPAASATSLNAVSVGFQTPLFA